MAESATQHENRNTSYRDYGGRLHSYGTLGVILLLGMIVAVVLAYYQVQGPNIFLLDVAVWVLALVVFVMALCLLYVLFTLRGALRLVRAQATEVAVMRALAHRHEILEPAPTPAITYNPPAEQTQPAPAPTYVPPMAESRDVESIEGIGPVFARRLARAGIETVRDLRAATPEQVSGACNAPRATVDRWKAMADLLVVRDIDPQAAEILVACGVYSVEGLAAQDVDTLHRRCKTVNTKGGNRIVPNSITREMVQTWVEGAKHYGVDGTPVAKTTPRADDTAAPADAY